MPKKAGAKTGQTEIAGSQAAAPRRVTPSPAAKRAAVIRCVNNAMDANQSGWNSDGNGDGRKMGDFFGYNTNSMPAFLGVVARCLKPTYTLDVDKMSMDDCVAATVVGLKTLVFKNTT